MRASAGAIVPFRRSALSSGGGNVEDEAMQLNASSELASYMRYHRRMNNKKVAVKYPDLVKRFNDPAQRTFVNPYV